MENSVQTPSDVLHLGSTQPKDHLEPWSQDGAGMGTDPALDMDLQATIGFRMSGGLLDSFEPNLDYQIDTTLLDTVSGIPASPYNMAFPPWDHDSLSFYEGSCWVPPHDQPELEASITAPSNIPASKDEKPDNKLLSFKPPITHYSLSTSSRQQTWPSITAELNGMFFVAEDVYGEPAQSEERPVELTCYRRNLFQISGNIIINRDINTVVTNGGVRIPVFGLSATLSAVDGADGKSTEIISVPWKPGNPTAQIPGASVEEKSGSSPHKIPLDMAAYPEIDPAIVSLPIAWRRLQFKHATANNGRRKGLQQTYIVHICLMGILGTGEEVKLMETHSGPIIVRGRSPRNFDSKKEVNLSSTTRPKAADIVKGAAMKIDPGVSNGNGTFYAQNTVQQSLDIADWSTPGNTSLPLPSPSLPGSDSHMSKKSTLGHNAISPATQRPPLPKTRWKSTSLSIQPASTPKRSTQTDLSILESTSQKTRTSSHSGPRTLSLSGSSPVLKRRESSNTRSGSIDENKSTDKKSIGSPLENADMLYEYFPLSLDDWMPPVDAIYRPHVVHHTVVPPDLDAELGKSKTKRYFVAED